MNEELEKFQSHIWGTGGTVFLAHKNNPTEFDVPAPRRWPEDKDRIITYFLTAAARGKDVYFSPAIYKDDAKSKHKANVLQSRVLWVDLDEDLQLALDKVANGECVPPTYRICSGQEGHEHWYWILDKFYPTEIFEPVNKKLGYFLGADHCWNADRVLRPPMTRNMKDPKNPLPVDIVGFEKVKYSLDEFDFLPDVTNASAVAEQMLKIEGDLPTIADVLADYPWNAQHKDVFLNPPDVKGSRDQSLMRVAYYMAEQGMPDEYMWVALDDMTRRLGKFVGRPDRNRRLSDMIMKAREKHPYGGPNIVVNTGEDIQQVYTANEFLRADFHMEWLVENLLAHRSVNIVEALPGTGKSRLTLQWAECLATGKKFLNWDIERSYKTMYISLEMDRYMLKHFFESLTENVEYDESVSDNFLMVPVGEPIPIGTQNGFDLLVRHLEMHRPEIVFIDALGSLTEKELGEEISKLINRQLNALIAKYDVCFVLVHHLRKDPQGKKGPPTRSDTYGSYVVAANAALILALWAPDEQDRTHVELISLKNRGQKEDKPIVLDGDKGFKFIIREDEERDEEDAEPRSRTRKGPSNPFSLDFE